MKSPAIVEVTWTDAYMNTSGNRMHQDDFENVTPHTLLKSVGYLVRNDKSCVTLSMESRDSDRTYRDYLTLPKGMVQKIRKLK